MVLTIVGSLGQSPLTARDMPQDSFSDVRTRPSPHAHTTLRPPMPQSQLTGHLFRRRDATVSSRGRCLAALCASGSDPDAQCLTCLTLPPARNPLREFLQEMQVVKATPLSMSGKQRAGQDDLLSFTLSTENPQGCSVVVRLSKSLRGPARHSWRRGCRRPTSPAASAPQARWGGRLSPPPREPACPRVARGEAAAGWQCRAWVARPSWGCRAR